MNVENLNKLTDRVANDLHVQLRAKGSRLLDCREIFDDPVIPGRCNFYTWAQLKDGKWVGASADYPGALTLQEYDYILNRLESMKSCG